MDIEWQTRVVESRLRVLCWHLRHSRVLLAVRLRLLRRILGILGVRGALGVGGVLIVQRGSLGRIGSRLIVSILLDRVVVVHRRHLTGLVLRGRAHLSLIIGNTYFNRAYGSGKIPLLVFIVLFTSLSHTFGCFWKEFDAIWKETENQLLFQFLLKLSFSPRLLLFFSFFQLAEPDSILHFYWLNQISNPITSIQ